MSTSPGATDGSQRNSLELDADHAQRVPGAEQGGMPTPQVKLKERQKFFEEAFQQDMEQYLSTGYLQIAERRANGIFSYCCAPTNHVPSSSCARNFTLPTPPPSLQCDDWLFVTHAAHHACEHGGLHPCKVMNPGL